MPPLHFRTHMGRPVTSLRAALNHDITSCFDGSSSNIAVWHERGGAYDDDPSGRDRILTEKTGEGVSVEEGVEPGGGEGGDRGECDDSSPSHRFYV